jgi:protein TonB
VRSYPFLASFVVHSGALVALAVTCATSGPAPAPALPVIRMRLPETESPEVPEPQVAVPPDPAESEMTIEPEPMPEEAEAEDEPEPIDFGACDIDVPSPTPLPFPRMVARIPRLRRPEKATVVAPVRAPSPPPVAAPVSARITAAVPQGDLCRPPKYPAQAQRRGHEGHVVLRVHVGVDGRPLGVEVEESSGHSLLDEAAVAAVREWTFEPAREGDRAVESLVHVPFRFRLRG